MRVQCVGSNAQIYVAFVCAYLNKQKKHTTFLECVCVLHNVMVGRYSNRRDGTARIIEQTPRYELISHSCAYLPLLFVDKNSDLIQPWAKRHRTAYKIRLITVDPQSQTIWVRIWNVNCARCATVPINLNTEHLLNTTWYDKLRCLTWKTTMMHYPIFYIWYFVTSLIEEEMI